MFYFFVAFKAITEWRCRGWWEFQGKRWSRPAHPWDVDAMWKWNLFYIDDHYGSFWVFFTRGDFVLLPRGNQPATFFLASQLLGSRHPLPEKGCAGILPKVFRMFVIFLPIKSKCLFGRFWWVFWWVRPNAWCQTKYPTILAMPLLREVVISFITWNCLFYK